ncbi:hypothetical protein [Flagellimonas marinaquae]|uniref:hypothetical protein n=1 Tax=Flagellimonas marinaquae TaxID=254955 RepID=UPI000F8CE596|nr:hypothetical protein [Allomuricauda aquimarina]
MHSLFHDYINPKITILLFFGVTILAVPVFAQKKFAYQVECVSVETNGSVTIKIWNSKLGKRYDQEKARKDAVDAILKSGVPGNNGCVLQKPLLVTTESIQKFKKIEKAFFAKHGLWSNYTRQATSLNTLPEKIGKKKWKVYQVTIAMDLLRKYLKEKRIIKSLNSGF